MTDTSSATSGAAASEATPEQMWWVFQRVQEVNSAIRINVIRMIAVISFVAVHLFNYFPLSEPSKAQREFHFFAMLIAATWLFVCVVVFIAYRVKFIPPLAKYTTTLTDIALLTTAACIGAKTQSWLVLIYLLIIASAVLRFDKKLIVFATIGSLAGYLILVGVSDTKWFDENHGTPLAQIAIVVISIGLAGFIGLECCRGCKLWFLRQSKSSMEV